MHFVGIVLGHVAMDGGRDPSFILWQVSIAVVCSGMNEFLDEYESFTKHFDFSLKADEDKGKWLVADKDLEANEELIEELPLVCWPSTKTTQNGTLFCERCLHIVARPEQAVRCSACPVVFCSAECQASALEAHGLLCPDALPAVREWQQQHNPAAPITLESLIRCIAHIAASTLQYVKAYGLDPQTAYYNAVRPFNRLIAPPEIPIEGFDIAAAAQEVHRLLHDRLQQDLGRQVACTLVDPDLIKTLLGQLVLNSQAIQITGQPPAAAAADAAGAGAGGGNGGPEGDVPPETETPALWVEGAGVYVLQSCLNHSCEPNADIVWGEDASIIIKVLRPVPKGEELTISYIRPELPYAKRQELLANYFFKCACPRCKADSAAAPVSIGPVRTGGLAKKQKLGMTAD